MRLHSVGFDKDRAHICSHPGGGQLQLAHVRRFQVIYRADQAANDYRRGGLLRDQ